jgi:uncharacterized membrane protein HdeD (DUF308 family)
MTKQIATILGGILIVAGLVGFVAPGLMGMHLSPVHNVIHLVSGALALGFGLAGSFSATRTFCTLFGLVYGLLGVLGFILAGPGGMWTIAPQLTLGTMDHIIHVILGGLFLFAGLYRKTARTQTSVPQ